MELPLISEYSIDLRLKILRKACKAVQLCNVGRRRGENNLIWQKR